MAATFVTRQPFGELGAARLQSLVSAKNCQNAVTEMLGSSGKEKPALLKPTASLNAPSKRSYEPTIFEDESDPDTENVDPALFSPKRSKGNDGVSSCKAAPKIALSTDSMVFSSVKKSPPATSNQQHNTTRTTLSPISPRHVTPPPHTLPTGSSTAPAGRSPKQHKRIGLLSSKRISLSPAYKRINPPSSTTAVPFSLDEAIRGTLAAANPSKHPIPDKSKPKGWYFDIYEDTPDEEAATMMEHSTCMLDLSSDDDADAAARQRDLRGKENIPPPGHVDPNPGPQLAPRAELSLVRAEVGSMTRRMKGGDVVMEKTEERAPLGALAPEDFYAEGLHAASVEVVAAESEEGAKTLVGGGVELKDEASTVLRLAASVAGDEGPAFVIAEDEAHL